MIAHGRGTWFAAHGAKGVLMAKRDDMPRTQQGEGGEKSGENVRGGDLDDVRGIAADESDDEFDEDDDSDEIEIDEEEDI